MAHSNDCRAQHVRAHVPYVLRVLRVAAGRAVCADQLEAYGQHKKRMMEEYSRQVEEARARVRRSGF